MDELAYVITNKARTRFYWNDHDWAQVVLSARKFPNFSTANETRKYLPKHLKDELTEIAKVRITIEFI